MVETRPNIVFILLLVNYFAKNPSHQYTIVVKTIPKYLKRSKYSNISYGEREELKIERYSDSN